MYSIVVDNVKTGLGPVTVHFHASNKQVRCVAKHKLLPTITVKPVVQVDAITKVEKIVGYVADINYGPPRAVKARRADVAFAKAARRFWR